jgi:DNA integrity scanning protein DisA with diadenylate cyclase activity
MKLNQEFFANLDKLEKYKTNQDLKVFFDSVDKLEKIRKEINDEIYESPSDKLKLDRQAKDLTKKLEEKKDEIAMHTKTQKEYDAVYECIDYLESHFN